MTEDREFALLFAATLLAARKLNALDSDRPSPAKISAVENAIDQAKFILERIDQRWPFQSEN
jgi:hypothetical protein